MKPFVRRKAPFPDATRTSGKRDDDAFLDPNELNIIPVSVLNENVRETEMDASLCEYEY